MAHTFDLTAIQARLDALNEALGGLTPFKLALVDPRTVKPAEKNARFMTQGQISQLTANIARDGNLSTVPFAWKDADGVFHWIAGHHRARAAIDADVPYLITLYTDAEMSQAERIARQLGDNAIVGQDDPQILADLYATIRDFDWKEYSGLDDQVLNYKAALPPLGAGGNLRLEPVTFMLFAPEIEALEEARTRLTAAPVHRLMGVSVEVWDQFFDALLDYGKAREIVSANTALAMLTELARAALAFTSDDDLLALLDCVKSHEVSDGATV